jgi:hypothetical protein
VPESYGLQFSRFLIAVGPVHRFLALFWNVTDCEGRYPMDADVIPVFLAGAACSTPKMEDFVLQSSTTREILGEVSDKISLGYIVTSQLNTFELMAQLETADAAGLVW